ncbi:lycopene cyclase domain-containing protein [Pyxidicoccus xibeiensis]|uniref:lycopene cyclase domain-containing protein n=1 Tax=Pyxidicoccus xibeiensis TaxID=2906759 RepID=UPI0020A7B9AF|nr:lycopene cyclase domain-containing protein [Pyxidicoccus xibeiensis]MCP3144345.1 lycopene cyclase domain-containing protein [Pyxidicoccus xibeiensis]
MRYEFLVLSLLFLVPGVSFWLTRPDLRPLMLRAAGTSLPFAATEWLFYPEYWTPRFLFGLADLIGFGIEDVLFVVGLGAFSSSSYAVVFRRTPVPQGLPVTRPWLRAAGAFTAALAVTGALLAAGVPILYAAVVAMVSVSTALLLARRDLAVPSLLGALLTALIYLGLCLVFAALVPGVFDRTWRPSLLFPGRLLGVPLDEVLYGLGAGFGATAVPMWAFGWRFMPLRQPPGLSTTPSTSP